MQFQLSYKRYGAQAILIEWPAKINVEILHDVLGFKRKIDEHYIDLNVQIIHAYCSILIDYKINNFNYQEELEMLQQLYGYKPENTIDTFNRWKIPVCYEAPFATDLESLSKSKGLSKEDIIDRHIQGNYTVYFIGFLPGFLYLGGLDPLLHTPRWATPRLEIEKGAVAIGGNQTGIYPFNSPGGWHVIGNSPIHFFDATKKQPCFAKAGDEIQFVRISAKQYRDTKILADAKVYQLESEVIHD
ncbi:5-oxoprolinase subunit PxpB [Aestuariivivens sediminicola]|uniref:5-oxoprolinase subunit PxpB n=1 Tax=Aestuariivivens sediminicola TaxID=2913560 RepID=UPI001F592202|nr:5-oxoprolinase subunit PxpB [Aestuariivivens sediminicola]